MTGTSEAGLLTFGETMGLVTAGEIGPLEYARSFTYGIGGAESNVAIGVSRLGAAATWIGRLGGDATGDMIERRLLSEGVAGEAAPTRLRTAIAAGAYAVSVPGDCEGLPRRAELAALGSLEDVAR